MQKLGDLDLTRRYAEGRVSFLVQRGKVILVIDYAGLAGPGLVTAIEAVTGWLCGLELGAKEILNLIDFTGCMGNTAVIEKLKESAQVFTKPHVRRTAVVGLSGLQRIFVNTFARLGVGGLKAFDARAAALDWLVAEG